jgi:hypothetical protein
VRGVWIAKEPPLGCEPITPVSATGCARDEYDARERARNQIRNHTAGMGGSGCVVEETTSSLKREHCVTLSGKVVKCQALPDADKAKAEWIP